MNERREMRFLHTSDWQLGMTRHFLSPEEQGRYSEARLEAVRSIAALARDEACDFVVVSGDVFESNAGDRQLVARALDAMALFTVPVYLLPGNHDPLTAAGSVYDSVTFINKCPDNVLVLRSSAPVAVPGCDVEIVGAPWETKRPLQDLVQNACLNLEPGPKRVLVGHGAIDSFSPDAENPALIRLNSAEQAIDDGLIHYVALGDRHSVTDVGRTGRIWYSGTPLVTAYVETEPNKVLLVQLEGDLITVEPRQIGSWRFCTQNFAVNSEEDVDLVSKWFDEIKDKRQCVVKLSLVGTVDLATKTRLDDLIEENRALLVALETWERHTDLVVSPTDADFADLGLSGFVATTVDELRELALAAPDESTVAQDAVGLLYRLARTGQ
jgi:DNA repair exonuclease SbcCD nuclease subunit